MHMRVAGLAVEQVGSGPSVVLLHGSGIDGRLWDEIVPALAASYTVIRYDARGLGDSDSPTTAYSDIDDLASVLDACDVGAAALVGMSMGGETAIDMALIHPGRVTALALVGAAVAGVDWPETAAGLAYDEARRCGDAERLARLELEVWASLGPLAPGGPLIERMVWDNAYRRIAAERHLSQPTLNAGDHLHRIAAPTVVLWGGDDHPGIAAAAERLTTGIPDAKGHTIEGADHYLPLRTPQALLNVLLAHLATRHAA
ncbi:alpha/beta fold hydrolase [Catellatospora tritici]|uniref:alpha/beta fold hydrolase n=1 Tax=Catellatospora tritici TaxID=2851566 RepID=UPI001C2CD1E6|nr:alpha/beta fold hydrolase [Catellatospora tritici]MBV1850584.1 alpha/beta fold hydrolase [Catellatospora tritici]